MSSSTSSSDVQNWLGKQLRVVVRDGRLLQGDFVCLDREGNIILDSCKEYRTL